MHELDLVVFDLAGTTVEDRGQVPDAFTAAFAQHGIAVSAEQVKSVRGTSKREAVLRLIPAGPEQEQRAAAVYASFRAQLAERYAREGVQPIAGTRQVFRLLREQGVRIALNTGFDRDTTGLVLAALGWAEGAVDAVVCGDDVPRGRPAPFLIFRAMEATGVSSVHRIANVGDTASDLQAGYNAGVRWNIGVLSGAHERATLESAPHTHLLSSVADLPNLWLAPAVTAG